ncbi:MAG: response regulator [Mucispirillum sp.]|nr:response regulator [Mucispirillum sp.]
MGSELELETKEGEGSVFSFELSMRILEEPDRMFMANKTVCLQGSPAYCNIIKEYIGYFGCSAVTIDDDFGNIPDNADMFLIDTGIGLENFKVNAGRIPDNIPITAVTYNKYKNDIETIADVKSVIVKPVTLSKLKTFFRETVMDADRGNKKSGNKAALKLSGNVLVAEDNPVNQKLMLIFLEKFGINVTMVNNGAEAVEAVKNGDFKLIFMDIHMPVMDGVTASAEIRKAGVSVPIIALTADVIKENIDGFLASGMNEYMSKPINFDNLTKTLLKYFRS